MTRENMSTCQWGKSHPYITKRGVMSTSQQEGSQRKGMESCPPLNRKEGSHVHLLMERESCPPLNGWESCLPIYNTLVLYLYVKKRSPRTILTSKESSSHTLKRLEKISGNTISYTNWTWDIITTIYDYMVLREHHRVLTELYHL